ncbi:hypothetical protein MKEN_00850900 [Mycena kentingensis (nom. inval.)]|nr:hypothetical protein MKEN_00850900 [Mycena kentingensis (nom. inval.)]
MAVEIASSEPFLPLDLERTVFELGCSGTKEIVSLLQVAHRVRAWLEPKLYETIFIGPPRTLKGAPYPAYSATLEAFQELVRRRPMLPLATRNLFVSRLTVEEERRVFDACPNATNVFVHKPVHPLEPYGADYVFPRRVSEDWDVPLHRLPALTRLDIDILHLGGPLRTPFSSLTHLNIRVHGASVVNVSAVLRIPLHQILEHMPSLTHLAFNILPLLKELSLLVASPASERLQIIIVQACSREVLALWARAIRRTHPHVLEDPRIFPLDGKVFTSGEDRWLHGIHSEGGMWELAEKEVACAREKQASVCELRYPGLIDYNVALHSILLY